MTAQRTATGVEHALTDAPGQVLQITLARPERRNALSGAQLLGLPGWLEGAAARGCRAVVITGAGGNFSAGMDFQEITGSAEDAWIDSALERIEGVISGLAIPVIAAVEGACVGGAFDLALSCDDIVAGAGSFFALPATRLGLLYRTPVIEEILARAGLPAATRLLLAGKRLSGREALRLGLIGAVVRKGGALAAALELGRETALGAPAAVAATKGVLRSLRRGEHDQARWDEVRSLLDASAERASAVAAARARHGPSRSRSQARDAAGQSFAGGG